MGRKLLPLVGKRFGRWTVLALAGQDDWGEALWRCRCDCGHAANVRDDALRFGVKQACNKCAKLAKPNYKTIAVLRADGVKQTDTARRLGVSRQYVGNIVDFLENRVRIPRSKTQCRRG